MNPLNINGEEYLTKEELSVRLKLCVRTVVRWMRIGRIPYHRFGKKILRYKWSEVQKCLEEKEHEAWRSGNR